MEIKKETLKIWYIFFYSILFTLIPWENIRSLPFTDRENYLDYVYYGINILDYKDFNSIYSYIFNEWLWHYIIKGISQYISYEYFFYLISFSLIFCMTYFLVKNISIYASFFLLNPLIVDLALSQYRISLAIVFISLALFFYKNIFLRLLFFSIPIFIHTSALIFIVIFIFINILNKIHWEKVNISYVLVLFGAFLSFLMSDYLNSILSFFGDRRDYSDIGRISSSFFYISFWLIVLIFLILNSNRYFNKLRWKNTLSQQYSLIILSMIAANIIFGGYSTRFLAVSFPVIIKSIYDINIKIRLIILFLYLIYLSIQWWFWMK